MLINVYVIGGFVFLLGFVKQLMDRNKVKKRQVFAIKYLKLFNQLIESTVHGNEKYENATMNSAEAYEWLVKNVDEIQTNLGAIGKIDYLAPFQRYRIPNYPILLNTIRKFPDGSIEEFDINHAKYALARYMGVLEKQVEKAKKQLFNPFNSFSLGVKTILIFPLYILGEFGVLNIGRMQKIKTSKLFDSVSSIVTLISFLSGIVTIILGYEETVSILRNFFNL